MKWIGQHIWDHVARLRSDVYLDDISTGTIASGAHLGLDSNNKIVKAAVSSGISFDGSTANGVLTYKDADEATVEQYLTFDNSSNISTLGLTSNEDTGDLFKIATTTHGATTLTTIDDDASAANLNMVVDGVFGVTTTGGRNNFFKAGNTIDYFSINVGTNGATTINTTDADAASADLTIEPDGAFIVSSTGIDIASNGTITNATWQGTAIATDYLKHKSTFELAGYAVADGTNYMMADIMSGNKAPFLHDETSIGANGTTADNPAAFLRTAGTVMPYNGALKIWKGWAASNGTPTVDIAIFKYTPTADDASNASLVLVKNTQITGAGNDNLKAFSETSFSVTVAAGDILITAIKGSVNAKTAYFTSTVEIEWTS